MGTDRKATCPAIVTTSTPVTIHLVQLGSGEAVVIPFVAIRDTGQRELPLRGGRWELARQIDRYFHVGFDWRAFDFRRFAFQSNRDFERFCALTVRRIRCISWWIASLICADSDNRGDSPDEGSSSQII